MECNTPCKVVVTLSLIALYLSLVGCAGTVKTKTADGAETTTPAAVAVMEAASLSHEACAKDEAVQFLSPEQIQGMSASAQAKYLESLPMMMALGMIQKQNDDGGCHAQVSAEVKAYMAKEAGKYGMWRSIGTAGIWGVVTYGGIKAFTGMVDGAVNAAGDQISTGDITVTKSDDPIGGEGGGASGDIGGQSVVIGSGRIASGERSTVMDAEKGINFPGDSNMDADGAPAGTTGVTLDDSGDGGGNSIVPGF